MRITSLSDIAVGGYARLTPAGGHAFVVLAKATFRLQPGEVQLAELQDALSEGDYHWHDDVRLGVYAPSDMAPCKELEELEELGCSLPDVQSRAFVEKDDGSVQDVALQADALWIDTTRGVCTLTWRGSFAIADADVDGRVLVALQQPGQRLLYSDAIALESQLDARPSRPSSLPPLSQSDVIASPTEDNAEAEVIAADDFIDEVSGEFFEDDWDLERAAGAGESHTVALRSRPNFSRALPFLPAPKSPKRETSQPTPPAASARHFPAAPPPPSPPASQALLPGTPLPAERVSEAPPPPPSRPAPDMRPSRPAPGMRPLQPTMDFGATLHSAARAPSEPSQTTAAADTPEPVDLPLAELPSSDTAQLPAVNSASPWIRRSLSAARHDLKPPPSPERDSIMPPPLMLVPEAAQTTTPTIAEDRSARDLTGPLGSDHHVELLGYDDDQVQRVREHWLATDEDDHEDRLASELRHAFGTPEPIAPRAARRHLTRIMTHNQATETASLDRSMRDAVDDEGVYHAPLSLLHGELRLSFCDIAELKATIASVAPYLKANETLASAVEEARELLAADALEGSPDAAAEVTKRIRDAYADDDAVDDKVVAFRVERLLLAKRSYQRRTLLDGEWIRAQLNVAGRTLPCYLPDAIAKTLPLFSKFTARIIGEVLPRQDQFEPSRVALRAVAVGRIVSHQENG